MCKKWREGWLGRKVSRKPLRRCHRVYSEPFFYFQCENQETLPNPTHGDHRFLNALGFGNDVTLKVV
jgi:hypothetical protein